MTLADGAEIGKSITSSGLAISIRVLALWREKVRVVNRVAEKGQLRTKFKLGTKILICGLQVERLLHIGGLLHTLWVKEGSTDFNIPRVFSLRLAYCTLREF